MIFLYQLKRASDQDFLVDGLHFQPDMLVGVLAPTFEELSNVGIFVDSVPDPSPTAGIPRLHVNPTTKELWYEYTPNPETEMDRFKKSVTELQAAIDFLIMNS